MCLNCEQTLKPKLSNLWCFLGDSIAAYTYATLKGAHPCAPNVHAISSWLVHDLTIFHHRTSPGFKQEKIGGTSFCIKDTKKVPRLPKSFTASLAVNSSHVSFTPIRSF